MKWVEMKMLIDQESRNSRGNFFENAYHKKGIRYGRCQFESAIFKGGESGGIKRILHKEE